MKSGGSLALTLIDRIRVDAMAHLTQTLVELPRLTMARRVGNRRIGGGETAAEAGVAPTNPGECVDMLG